LNGHVEITLATPFRMIPMTTQLLLVALLSVSFTTMARADDWQPEPGFRSLFNGRDLTGWCFRAKMDRSPPGSARSPRGSTARLSPAMRGSLEPGQSFLAFSEHLPVIFHVVSGFARLDSA
jgi:hypothetical protein